MSKKKLREKFLSFNKKINLSKVILTRVWSGRKFVTLNVYIRTEERSTLNDTDSILGN